MFTGLRIGIATAQFLADVRNLPVIPFSSLLAQALAVNKSTAGRIWALGDAKSKRVYTLCLSASDLQPLYQCKDDEVEALPPELAATKMKAGDLLTGEGAHLYSWPTDVTLIPKQNSYFSPDALAQMTHALFLAKRTISGLELQPRYLKTGQSHLP
jgi:tRNA threonylcarbamoyl adenosine modification protein YeaZ